MLTTLLPLLSLFLPATSASPLQQRDDINIGWPYGDWKIRGVNLGGWLLLEPFITPSLFEQTGNSDIIDEYTFGQFQGRDHALEALRPHWDTWITEEDFKNIAAAGLNHVRIPIGYWAYDVSHGEPYIQGQAEYLDKAIEWARQYGIKVMVDLHGAPGSQNGFDNSGQRGDALWPYDAENVLRTKNVVNLLSRKYSAPEYYGVVTSLAVLNEPATFFNDYFVQVNRQFNLDAYGAGRYPWAQDGNGDKSDLVLVISDGFKDPETFNNYMSYPNYEGVLLDHHQYTVFSDFEARLSDQDRLNTICNQAGKWSASELWLVVGEWSLATTDCAYWLNGRNRGARYDGSFTGSSWVGSCEGKTGNSDTWSPEFKSYLRKFWDVQTQVAEDNGHGWIYWTWKTESADEWSYSAGLYGGWIPWDASEHINSLADSCT